MDQRVARFALSKLVGLPRVFPASTNRFLTDAHRDLPQVRFHRWAEQHQTNLGLNHKSRVNKGKIGVTNRPVKVANITLATQSNEVSRDIITLRCTTQAIG